MHADGHCVGVSVTNGENLVVSDSAYRARGTLSNDGFKTFLDTFLEEHAGLRRTSFAL